MAINDRSGLPPKVSEIQTLVGKCLFCPLGDSEKRGVMCKITITEQRIRLTSEQRKYFCALGKEGEECVIPKIFGLAYRGTQISQRGDIDSIRY